VYSVADFSVLEIRLVGGTLFKWNMAWVVDYYRLMDEECLAGWVNMFHMLQQSSDPEARIESAYFISLD
jgi:hypothetical protein